MFSEGCGVSVVVTHFLPLLKGCRSEQKEEREGGREETGGSKNIGHWEKTLL